MGSQLTYLVRLFRLAKQGGIKVVCLLLCLSAMLNAQDLSNPHLIPYKDQLPGSHVYCIVEDSVGFVWIGTNDGLVRYDGTRIRTFGQSADSNSISGGSITSVLVEGDQLWCTHNNGISRIDLNDYGVRNYYFDVHNENYRVRMTGPQDVMSILRTRDGTLCAGLRYDGLVAYDAERDTFIRIRPPAELIVPRNDAYWSADMVLSMVEDRFEEGVVWLGTLAGIMRVDIHSESFNLYHWPQEDPAWETNLNSIRKLVQLPDGNLCWGTWNAGVHVMDPAKRSYARLSNTDDDYTGILTTTTSKLTLVGDTMLWVSGGIGVCSYDLTRQRVSSIWTNDYAQGEVYGFDYVDKDGRVYGTTIEGLNVYDPLLQQFKAYSFAAMDPTRRGMVFDTYHDRVSGKYLVCVRSEGLYTYLPRLDKWEKVEMPSGIDQRKIGSTRPTYDSDREYFIEVDENILIYDMETQSFKAERYHVDIPSSGIVDLVEDANHVIWIASARDGHFQLDRKSGKFTRFKTPGPQTQAAGERGVFYVDSKNQVWMKKRQSYHVYSYDDNKLYDFTDAGIGIPYIQTFAEVGGYMYFTSGGKLLRHSIDSFKFQVPDTMNGGMYFPTATPGKDGVIWGAQIDRLYMYDTKSGTSRNFSFEYGTAPQGIFNLSVADDGSLMLGDFERFIVVDPKVLRSNEELPIPYVSKIHVGDREIFPSVHGSRDEMIRLNQHEDFFSVDISSISYVMAGYNRFKYRLKDLKQDWTNVSGAQTINFTNVPSGEYTFELMAANNEGLWNEEVYSLPICIATPWYKTTISRVSGVVFLLGMIFLAYRYRVSQIRKEERLHTEYERQLADVEMSALRAQMNPHFIFNCLNSIENFIIKNDTLRASTYLHDFARLIRLILQNSRAKSIPLKDELEALELYLEMESLRFTNKFEYDIVVEPDVAVGQLEVPPMIIQPYVENAIWHGLIPKQEPGHLVVHLSRKNGTLSCSIEDDGIGRERSAEINSRRKHDKPKSMGMSITSERIEILNRLYNTNTTINIIDKRDSSGRPSGTRVELNVPVE